MFNLDTNFCKCANIRLHPVHSMNQLKSTISLSNKKSFFYAFGFYLFHIAVIFLINIALFLVFFENASALESDFILSKAIPAVYLLIISWFLVRNRGYKIFHINIALLGAVATYVLGPFFGYTFIAYLTTLGNGLRGDQRTLL